MSATDETTNLRDLVRLAAASVHVAYPGTVVSYERTAQRATVQIVPAFRRRDPEQGGAVVAYRVPPISGVPVAFPGAGGVSFTFPLAAGDSGLLVVTSRSMDEWLQEGGTASTPQDQRRHDLTDSVFLPGLRSFAADEVVPAAGLHATAAVIRADTLLLGDSAAASFVALATAVEAQLSALKTAIAAAPVVAGDGGASFKAALLAALASWPGSVAATKVRAT